jgi:hypothetical protein
MQEIVLLSKELALSIHSSLELEAHGFSAKENFDYLFDELPYYLDRVSESLASQKAKIAKVGSFLLFHLVKGHCFNDGNKRTAFVSFGLFLSVNNFSPIYDENNVRKKLERIYSRIGEGISFGEVMEKELDAQTPEGKMVHLLFSLAGAREETVYSSPDEINSIVGELVISSIEPDMLDSDATHLKGIKPVSVMDKKHPRVRYVSMEEGMKIAKAFMKKHKYTLELLRRA